MKNIFCSRKGGVTHACKKFTPLRTSDIMAHAIERHAEKMEARNRRRLTTHLRRKAAYERESGQTIIEPVAS